MKSKCSFSKEVLFLMCTQNEDRLKGKRNSLTDRDSGNGDSLEVGSCVLTFPSSLDAPRSTTPCFQHFQNQHLHQHQFQPLPPAVAFAVSTEPQQHQHQQYMTTSSPKEAVEVVDANGNPLTSTFVWRIPGHSTPLSIPILSQFFNLHRLSSHIPVKDVMDLRGCTDRLLQITLHLHMLPSLWLSLLTFALSSPLAIYVWMEKGKLIFENWP